MNPTSYPALGALAVGAVAFVIAFAVARLRSPAAPAGQSRRAWGSIIGIVLQGLAILVAAQAPVTATLAPSALVRTAATALLVTAGVALFSAAIVAMGRNWAVVAQTREDHRLVETGPFARLRNPIYAALFLMMLAIAIALGHEARLLWSIPLYALGTALRVRDEERLLHAQFGADYQAYAARVRRFGIF